MVLSAYLHLSLSTQPSFLRSNKVNILEISSLAKMPVLNPCFCLSFNLSIRNSSMFLGCSKQTSEQRSSINSMMRCLRRYSSALSLRGLRAVAIFSKLYFAMNNRIGLLTITTMRKNYLDAHMARSFDIVNTPSPKSHKPCSSHLTTTMEQNQSALGNSRNKSRNRQVIITKLQSKILELEKTVEIQKSQIRSLIEEKKCLQKICEKQQSKLNGKSYVESKEQFTKQLCQMVADRDRLSVLLQNIQSEHKLELSEYRQEIQSVRQSNEYLERTVREFMQDKTDLEQQLQCIKRYNTELSSEVEILKDQLFDKRNIERKYRISLQQIQRLEHRVRLSESS